VTEWKPHALARPAKEQLVLAKGAKVVARRDLAGVAEGMRGKVILANGFNWRRYRVLFANDVELVDLDGDDIAPVKPPKKR
jgi:hypothetical protein